MKQLKYTNHMILKGAWLTLLLTGIDQLTKYLAWQYLRPRRTVQLIPGVLDLFYLENRGAAFGILQNRQWIFILFSICMAAGCVWYARRLPKTPRMLPMRVCLFVLLSGAVGNMIDRVLHGYVIDFIYISLIRFPVFNAADIYVSVSVTVLVLLVLFFYREEDYDTGK